MDLMFYLSFDLMFDTNGCYVRSTSFHIISNNNSILWQLENVCIKKKIFRHFRSNIQLFAKKENIYNNTPRGDERSFSLSLAFSRNTFIHKTFRCRWSLLSLLNGKVSTFIAIDCNKLRITTNSVFFSSSSSFGSCFDNQIHINYY